MPIYAKIAKSFFLTITKENYKTRNLCKLLSIYTKCSKSETNSIELCSKLSVGETPPSYGLLKKKFEKIKIPIPVSIRPKSENFKYSKEAFSLIKKNTIRCKELGFNGMVSGVLNSDNSIDIARTKELIKPTKPLSLTFHSAFDCVKN